MERVATSQRVDRRIARIDPLDTDENDPLDRPGAVVRFENGATPQFVRRRKAMTKGRDIQEKDLRKVTGGADKGDRGGSQTPPLKPTPGGGGGFNAPMIDEEPEP
jgi:hypothetical protein